MQKPSFTIFMPQSLCTAVACVVPSVLMVEKDKPSSFYAYSRTYSYGTTRLMCRTMFHQSSAEGFLDPRFKSQSCRFPGAERGGGSSGEPRWPLKRHQTWKVGSQKSFPQRFNFGGSSGSKRRNVI